MAREGYTGVSLRNGWADAIDAWRDQFRYEPSRAEAVYEAASLLFLKTGFDPEQFLDDEEYETYERVKEETERGER